MLARSAKVHVYNPTPNQPLAFGLEAAANRKPRQVTLKSEGNVLAHWTASPDQNALLTSPPFSLKAGLNELTIECDGEDRPSGKFFSAQGSTAPFSLWATRVAIIPAGIPRAVAKQPTEGAAR